MQQFDFFKNMLDPNQQTSNKTDKKKLDSLHEVFTLPIKYNEKVKKLNENIITDLELVKTIDKEEKPIYDYVFKPTNTLGAKVLEEVPKYYTTDIEYLKETQTLVKNFKNADIKAISETKNFTNSDIEETVKAWEEIKGETGFHSRDLALGPDDSDDD